MKYTTATQTQMGGILKILSILSWAYLKYCQTDCICQLRLPATTTAYLVSFRGLYKINYYMWKSCRGEPRNLERLPRKTVVPADLNQW